MEMKWIVLAVAVAMYAVVVAFPNRKAWATVAAALVVVALGVVTPMHAVAVLINWNVLMIYVGSLVIAELFIYSRVPSRIADSIVERSPNTGIAIVAILMMTGIISAFVENVATVLVMAPIALALSKKLKLDPTYFMVGLAVMANLQGTATLVGDPPSMIFASYAKYGFNDFFVYQGRPSLFFAIQVGALASLVVLFFFFRDYRAPMPHVEVAPVKTWVPVGLILLMIAFLASSSRFDPGFTWLAGTGNVLLGLLSLLWYASRYRQDAKALLKRYDASTIVFLAGIFVLAYAMDRFGWVKAIADAIAAAVGDNRFLAYSLIVWVSVLVSAFVDNIAYVALMLPVTSMLSTSVGGSPFLYAAGLLIGACLGGNITPIGASCNVVACGILRREGRPVSFWQFARIGLPFTLAATTAGYLFIWVVFGR